MIRSICAFLLSIFAFAVTAAADVRDVYTVRDISVDEQAASIIEAREKAMSSAKTTGARILINRLTLAEDRTAKGVSMDAATADRLAAAVDVQDETAGAGRYRGKLAVVFNPRAVRAYLDGLGVPYIDSQAPLSVMIPVAATVNASAWRSAFKSGNNSALAPYITSGNTYPASADWSAISGEVASSNARRGVIAELDTSGGGYKARVSTLTSAGKELIGTTGAQSSMDAAARAASALLDDAWKRSSIVREGSRTAATAEVRYTSLAEWNTLRSALARSPLISEFKIRAIARGGAVVEFSHAGDVQRLRSELAQRGVALNQGSGAYILSSAVAGRG